MHILITKKKIIIHLNISLFLDEKMILAFKMYNKKTSN